MNKYVVVQDEWDDEDDLELLEYIKTLNYNLKIASKHEIVKMEPHSDLEMVFCNTSVMQQFIKNQKSDYKTVDSYPEYFRKFYYRNIKTMKLCEFITTYNVEHNSCFVKPVTNNKYFTGFVVNNNSFDRLRAYDAESEVYVCDKVVFVNEYRMFVGNNRVYGITESSKYLLDSKKIRSVDVDNIFVENILKKLQKYEPNMFCVIDVGLIEVESGRDIWSIVEVNPPYSLDNYDFPIDKYYDYCKTAYDSIIS